MWKLNVSTNEMNGVANPFLRLSVKHSEFLHLAKLNRERVKLNKLFWKINVCNFGGAGGG